MDTFFMESHPNMGKPMVENPLAKGLGGWKFVSEEPQAGSPSVKGNCVEIQSLPILGSISREPSIGRLISSMEATACTSLGGSKHGLSTRGGNHQWRSFWRCLRQYGFLESTATRDGDHQWRSLWRCLHWYFSLESIVTGDDLHSNIFLELTLVKDWVIKHR
ncbi:hypothetical protein ACH5RR_032246 [Cinchona calisaya]|uniref:Uncharacterized protein n=1 Tax=Cinchona calisaya TaxID=153742 RepID=A0ABD2YHI7_9GENT